MPAMTTTELDTQTALADDDDLVFDCRCCPDYRDAEDGSLACAVCNWELGCWSCAACMEPYHAEDVALMVEATNGDLYCPECLPG